MSFFQDILILGQPDKFQEELQLLQERNRLLIRLDEGLDPLKIARKESFALLKGEREAAINNVSLAKALLTKIRNRVDGEYGTTLTDLLAKIGLPRRCSHEDLMRKEKVSIVFNDVGDDLPGNLTASFDFIASRTKAWSFDAENEGVKRGVDAFISGGNALIAINEEIRERREVVMGKLIDVTTSLKRIEPFYSIIYAESQRALEISLVLNKTNQIFSRKYEQLLTQIFNQSRMGIFWDGLRGKRLRLEEEDLVALNQLVQIVTECIKLSQLKVEKLWMN